MKRMLAFLILALAIPNLCGCEDDEEGSGDSSGSLNGTWNGTMVVTALGGYGATDSDVVPITLIISETSVTYNVTRFSLVFQANEMPGIFTGGMDHDSRDIQFSATADYTYNFYGRLDSGYKNMNGTWSVNIPGGMSGTWQASR